MAQQEQHGQSPTPEQLVDAMATLAWEKGYSSAFWDGWNASTCQRLRVTTLTDAPTVNLERLLLLVQHWPDRRRKGGQDAHDE